MSLVGMQLWRSLVVGIALASAASAEPATVRAIAAPHPSDTWIVPNVFEKPADFPSETETYDRLFAPADTRLKEIYRAQPRSFVERESVATQTLRVRVDEAIYQYYQTHTPSRSVKTVHSVLHGPQQMPVEFGQTDNQAKINLGYEILTDNAAAELHWFGVRGEYRHPGLLSSAAAGFRGLQSSLSVSTELFKGGPRPALNYHFATKELREEIAQPLSPAVTSYFVSQSGVREVRLVWAIPLP